MRRAMNALVGHLHPAFQVLFERCPRVELPASERIALRVADATLGLALGPRPVRPTGPDCDTPVLAERFERRVYTHDPGLTVDDQRLRIVDQDRLSDAPKRRN